MSASGRAFDVAAIRATTRTPEEPLAFTRAELWRGGRRAWYVFLLELAALLIVPSIVNELTIPADQRYGSYLSLVPIYVVYGLVIGAPVSFLAMLAATPVAGVIGSAMRHVPSLLLHALAQVAVGAATGALVGFLLAIGVSGNSPADQLWTAASWLMLWGAILTALAAVLGWWSTARTALREDSQRIASLAHA